MIWQVSISSPDRERAFQALEVATLFALRRAVPSMARSGLSTA